MSVEEAREQLESLKRDAQRLLEEPATQRVLGYIRNHVVKTLENSEHNERELREHCYHLLGAVKEVDSFLRTLAAQGKLQQLRAKRSGDTAA